VGGQGELRVLTDTRTTFPDWRMKPYPMRYRSLLARIALACVLTCTQLNMRPASAQSLNLDAPAPLHQGNNQALIDSFVGDHYYYFYASPASSTSPGPSVVRRKASTWAANPPSLPPSIPKPPDLK
jgi:hypothetical protein